MSEDRSGTQYYMTSEFQDILVAEKFRNQVSIMGGGSKDFQHSMNLLDGTKSLLNYTSAYGVSDEFNKPENRDHEVNQMTHRLERHGRGAIKPIDFKVIAAGLQPPDPEKGIWDRVILTNDPDVKKLVTSLGGKTMSPEELGKQLKDNNLVGKEDLDLLKRSTKEQNKQLGSRRGGYDVTGAVKEEKQQRMQMRRQRVKERPSKEEMEQVAQQIKKQDVKDQGKARKFSKDELSGMG